MPVVEDIRPVGEWQRRWSVIAGHCRRHWRVHLRSPLVISGTLLGPVLLLIAIGVGLGSTMTGAMREDILGLIVPGLAAMGALLAASQHGIGVNNDRNGGLVDEVLAGPVSASTVVVAHAVSTTVVATLHGLAVFLVAAAVGLAETPANWVGFIAALAAFSLACSVGANAIGFLARQPGSIQAALNLVINPMFFLSGALFDISVTPRLVQALAAVNPVRYGVDLLQAAYSGQGLPIGRLILALAVLAVGVMLFAVVSVASLRRS